MASGMAISLSGCAWVDSKQRQLVYRPTLGQPADFAGLRPGDQSFLAELPKVGVTMPDRLQLWWMPNNDTQAPTLLYLHGTFRNLYQNLRKVEALREAGFSVVAVEYRGWGDSTPILPSEETIYIDANVAWAELVRRQPDPLKRVVFGHSMGSGVAVELASRMHIGADYGGLIVEAGFTRLPDIAKAAGVMGTIASWFSTQEFNSLEKIGKVDAPILMMHGTADRTVPIALGRLLFDAAPKNKASRWVEFPGGSHAGLDRESPELYRRTVRGFIEQMKTGSGLLGASGR